jgi:hypothetical protein
VHWTPPVQIGAAAAPHFDEVGIAHGPFRYGSDVRADAMVTFDTNQNSAARAPYPVE